jgi:4'-phosphopantetheinyl transferase EntD
VLTVGVDAEPHAPLPDGVADVVLVDDDRLPPVPGVHLDRVAFSAKESAYKAWYPLRGRLVDFAQVVVTVGPDGTFAALVDDDLTLGGRWLVQDGLVLTAVVVLRRPD